MNGTRGIANDYFRRATVGELRLLLLIVDQNQHLEINWDMLVQWANGYGPNLPAARIISIMQEVAERAEKSR